MRRCRKRSSGRTEIPADAVFDASVLIRAIGEPGEPTANEWLAAATGGRLRVRVPDLVYAEAASGFAKYVRTGEITPEQAEERLDHILRTPLEAVPDRLFARQALALAITRGISAYDACYLALAIGYDAVLVTADRRLAEAAERFALLPRDHPPPD